MMKSRLLLTLVQFAVTAALWGQSDAVSTALDTSFSVDPQVVAELLEELVPAAMADADIPGVAVTLVHAGTVVALEGFGQADVEAGIPVDPERTVFRLGSISKPLTATTILAVLEDDDFDLDRDVRPLLEDLDFRPDYPQAITLRQLLTHTAGFNENLFGQHARRAADWLPLDRYLTARLTPRFAPPGEVIAYTDFHTSLAGLVAARLAETTFENLADERLFAPLGMASSSFRQVDLPPDIEGALARSYGRRGRKLTAYPRDYLLTTPAAGLQSTAADMARYLIALLDDGTTPGSDTVVMSAESWRTQKRVHHRHHELVSGKALGLTEVRHGGRTLLYKNGQASGFHARILLAPEERLGMFSVHNRSIIDPMGAFNAASRVHRELGWKLFDALLPEIELPDPGEPVPAPGTSERLAAYEGHYRTTIASRHTAEKIISMMDGLEVRRIEGDRLAIGSGTYVEVEPGLLQYEGERFYVSAAPPVDGRFPYLFMGAGAYERIPWYESPASTIQFAIGFITLFLVGLLLFSWRSWRLGSRRAPGSAGGRRLSRSAAAVSALCFLFLVAFGSTMALTDVQHLFQGWPWSMKLALALPILAVMAMVVLVRALLSAGARRQAGRMTTAFAVVVLAGSVIFLWWLDTWNLLGWRL